MKTPISAQTPGFGRNLGITAMTAAVVITCVALLALIWIGHTQHQRHLQSTRSELVERLGRIRADLESTLNGSLVLTEGVGAAIFAHGRLSDGDFRAVAEKMVSRRSEVRNLGVAYGTTLSQVYPLAGNEKALGLDYRLNDKQWPAVEHAITTGATVVSGPIPLVQGGVGIISRTPVFRRKTPNSPPEYFGLVSIVIDFTTLVERGGLTDVSDSMIVALEDISNPTQNRIIFGLPEAAQSDSVSSEVRFPGGKWRLHAAPVGGWVTEWWRHDTSILGLGVILVALVGLAAFAAAAAWRQHRRLYMSLMDSEGRYRNLLETAPVAVLVHRDGNVLLANCETAKLLGAENPQDLVNRPIRDLVHPDYHPLVSDRVRSLNKIGDQTSPLRIKMLTLEGRVIDVDASGALVVLDGLPTVMAVLNDTSRWVRAEAARQAVLDDLQRSNDELRQFATAASHDLQEPLRQVTGYVQMLERRYKDLLDKDGRDFIGFAVAGVDKMRRLLHDLQVYSQLQTAGAPLTRLSTAEILNQVAHELDDEMIVADAQLKAEKLPFIQGDHEQIRQLFANLLDNALRYSRGDRKPKIVVTAQRQGGQYLFSFADNGIGIPPEYHAQVFDVFKRLHGAGQVEGTGFGLAICRRIVERHGGRIWVESEAGQGANFLFTLPAA